MTPWSHLPNAALIDRVLEDAQAHPEAWASAGPAAWGSVRSEAREAARGLALDAALDAAWEAAWDAASARGEVWYTAKGAARLALGDAILALIAWDDCGHLLSDNLEQVQVLALLGHTPAILMLPAAMALNKSMTHSV